MDYPLERFHKQIVLSLDPETKYCPFGENITLVIELE